MKLTAQKYVLLKTRPCQDGNKREVAAVCNGKKAGNDSMNACDNGGTKPRRIP
jgi:hypothetical protein